MAINIELRRADGTDYDEIVYFRTSTALVSDLRETTGDYTGKIKTSWLSQATSSNALLGIVKMSDVYNPGSPDLNTVLSQAGAKSLYSIVQNLTSPLDYVSSSSFAWTTTETQTSVDTAIYTWLHTELPAIFVNEGSQLPGHAVLINNTHATPLQLVGTTGNAINTGGYWLWVYNGTHWYPAVDYPEILPAVGAATEGESTAGIMTKAYASKLFNISVGANKVEDNHTITNGTIKIDGIATTVYTHPTTAGNVHVPTGGVAGNVLTYGGASGNASWGAFDAIVMANYAKTAETGSIAANDDLITAFSKIENKLTAQAVTDHATNGSITVGPSTEIVVYAHPTTAGNKHIPTAGAANNILAYGGTSGAADWAAFTAMAMTGYSKTADKGAIAAADTLIKAFSRVENQLSYIPLCADVTALNALTDKTAGKLAMLVVSV